MPLPNATYPFDPTGMNIVNRVVGEQHIVTDNNYKNFFFCVPKFGPFFANSIQVNNIVNGAPVPLTEGIDYYCAIPFIGATRSIGLPVYGGISFSNLNISGIVTITYQTLGGEWLYDDAAILTTIANQAYNPRIISWEQITGIPNVFPVINHAWNLNDMVGQTEILNQLSNIESAILTRAASVGSTHLTNLSNPHGVTKTQVGLGNVENYAPASLAQAAAGTSTNTVLTPAALKYVIDTGGFNSGGNTGNQTVQPLSPPQLIIADGTTQNFNFNTTVTDPFRIIVTINYVLQDPLDAYSLINNNTTLRLGAIPNNGDRILIRFI